MSRPVERQPPAAPRRPDRRWVVVGWALLLVAAGLQRWAPAPIVERLYSRGLYPWIAALLSLVNEWAGFSLAEAGAILLPPALLFALVWSAVRARRMGVRWGRWLAGTTGRGIAAAGWILFAFSLLWGLNYRRVPLSERLGIPNGGTAEELAATARWLAGELARHAPPTEHRDRPAGPPYPWEELAAKVEDAYEALPVAGEGFPRRLGPAKPVHASGILSRLGLSGIFIPFTGEPNVNRLLPHPSLVAAVAHEKAHQRGITHESEASFAAFLALYQSSDPYLRYCGLLEATGSVLGALARTDPEAFAEVARAIPATARADWARSREFWARYRGPAQRVSRRVNDLYLRANRVPGGVQSYGAVVDLLVGYYLAEASQEP
jgi:hypothetical protein